MLSFSDGENILKYNTSYIIRAAAADLRRRDEVQVIEAAEVEGVLCQKIRFKLCRPEEEESQITGSSSGEQDGDVLDRQTDLPQQFTGGVVGGASLLVSPASSVRHVHIHLVPFVQRRRQTDCGHEATRHSTEFSSEFNQFIHKHSEVCFALLCRLRTTFIRVLKTETGSSILTTVKARIKVGIRWFLLTTD